MNVKTLLSLSLSLSLSLLLTHPAFAECSKIFKTPSSRMKSAVTKKYSPKYLHALYSKIRNKNTHFSVRKKAFFSFFTQAAVTNKYPLTFNLFIENLEFFNKQQQTQILKEMSRWQYIQSVPSIEAIIIARRKRSENLSQMDLQMVENMKKKLVIRKLSESLFNMDLQAMKQMFVSYPTFNIDSVNSLFGYPPLIEFIRREKEDIALYLIEEKGVDIFIKDIIDETPLGAAARRVLVKLVEVLIEKGADVNQRGFHGMTPLMNAVYEQTLNPMRRTKIVSLLLENGADVFVRDYFHLTTARGFARPMHTGSAALLEKAERGQRIKASVERTAR